MKFIAVIPPSGFLLDDRVFMSLGPVQIATNVRDFAGWEVEVLDLTGHARECALAEHGPECVWPWAEKKIAALKNVRVFGLYSMSCHVPASIKVNKLIKTHHPASLTLAGGPHASLQPQDFEKHGVDAVVMAQTGGGSGEIGVLAALRDVSLFGRFRKTRYESLKDKTPSKWSWPDRNLVDWKSYAYKINGELAASIVTQFGCPYVCTFCSHGPGYTKIRYRHMDHVRAELRELREKFGYKAVMLYDDETNISKKHFAELCTVLREEGFRWRAFIKSNLFSEEQAKLAAASGAAEFCTGAESADPDIKKAILKKSTVEHDSNFVRWCVENKIAAKCFTMVGLPGESNESAQRTLTWLLEMAKLGGDLFHFDVSVYCPFPGTPLFDNPEKYGLKVLKQIDYAEDEIIYKGRPGEYRSFTETAGLTAAEIVAWRDRIEKEVNASLGRQGPTVGGGVESASRSSAEAYEATRRIDGG